MVMVVVVVVYLVVTSLYQTAIRPWLFVRMSFPFSFFCDQCIAYRPPLPSSLKSSSISPSTKQIDAIINHHHQH